MAVPFNIFCSRIFCTFSKLLTKANVSDVSNLLVFFGMTIFVSVRLKSFQNIFNWLLLFLSIATFMQVVKLSVFSLIIPFFVEAGSNIYRCSMLKSARNHTLFSYCFVGASWIVTGWFNNFIFYEFHEFFFTSFDWLEKFVGNSLLWWTKPGAHYSVFLHVEVCSRKRSVGAIQHT